MDGKFLNQNLCMKSLPGVFKFGIFLSFAQSESWCMFVLRLSSCYLSSQHFHYVLSFSIFYSKIILFLFLPVVNLPLYTLHQSVSWIIFHYIGISCFVGIVWTCSTSFWVFLLSSIFIFAVLLSDLFVVIWSGGLFFRWVPVCFTFLNSFYICPSRLISHSEFVFLFGFLRAIPISLLTSFAPA